jgi:hypothetical protein
MEKITLCGRLRRYDSAQHKCSISCLIPVLPYICLIFGFWFSAAYSAYSCLIPALFLAYFCLIFFVLCSIFCLFPAYFCLISALFLDFGFLQHIFLIPALLLTYSYIIFWFWFSAAYFAYSSLIPCLFLPYFSLFFFRPHDVRFLCPPTRLR